MLFWSSISHSDFVDPISSTSPQNAVGWRVTGSKRVITAKVYNAYLSIWRVQQPGSYVGYVKLLLAHELNFSGGSCFGINCWFILN